MFGWQGRLHHASIFDNVREPTVHLSSRSHHPSCRPGILEEEPAGIGRERIKDEFVMVASGEHKYFEDLPFW
jgi:hypothetical protein